ncbi:putative DNA (cytosine-5-)-methyltransferase [Rosa chinensis]|uniref:Putative DNA (Cytosine-5-)-methyltransferase n=1 Tax=Rosa chinensis TaxID=74649 RepID=A0A2P6S983_ROSCH|nr:putative DNA (cytosine-5-)-methyltransferase [Rosa chinensis]
MGVSFLYCLLNLMKGLTYFDKKKMVHWDLDILSIKFAHRFVCIYISYSFTLPQSYICFVAYHPSVLKDQFPNGINVLSLFSGIAGAEIALHRLGILMKMLENMDFTLSHSIK